MRRPRPLLSLLLLALGVAVGVGVPVRTVAAQGGVRWTNAPLEEALVEFAGASGVDLVFAHRIVEGRRVTGQWRPGDDPGRTLATLLVGTGLLAERLRVNQYVILVEPLNVAIEPDDPAAYTGTLEGRIIDAETGEPLLGAHAFLIDLALGGVAKEDGSFTVPGIPTGEYAVRFSYVGYRTTTVTLSVYPEASQLPPTIRLRPEPVSLTGATATPGNEPESGAGTTDISPERGQDVRQAAVLPPDPGGGDLLRSLDWLPGLSRAPGAGGGLIVRGADPSLLRTVRDGVPVYAPAHAAGLTGLFQPEVLQGVRLHRGTPPIDVGGGLAGVLEVDPRDGRGEDLSGLLGLGPVAVRGVVASSVGDGMGVAAGVRHSALGWPVRGWPYAPALHRADGALVLDPLGGPLRHGDDGSAASYRFADAEGTFAWAPNPRHRLTVGGWGALDLLDAAPGGPLDAYGRWGSGLGSVRYRVLSGQTFVTGTVYVTGHRGHERVGPGTAPGGGPAPRDYGVTLLEGGARVDADRFLSLAHTLRVGASVARRDLNATLSDGHDEQLSQQATETALWALDVWRPDSGTQIEAGLRAETFGPRVRLSPRILTRWTVHPDRLFLRASAGRQTQGLIRLPDSPFGGTARASARWLLAGADVAPSTAWQVGGGTEWAPWPGLAFSADVYGRLMSGVWELRPGALPDAVALDSVRAGFAPTLGRAAGLEVAGRMGAGPWVFGLSYALARTETRTPPAVGASTPGAWRPGRYDRPQTLGLLVQRAGPRWNASARLDLLAGLPDGRGGRTPPQTRLELAVGYRFEGLGAQWDAQARVQPTAAGHVLPNPAVAAPVPLALAADGATLPAWPVVSLRASW